MNLAHRELSGRTNKMKTRFPATVEDAFLEKVLPGTSPKIIALREEIKVINAQANRSLTRAILLCGESGVGKNHFARVLAAHALLISRQGKEQEEIFENWATHATHELTEVLVPGIPAPMLEAELFGARKGAYTGLDRDREGAFGGEGSIILLDEIGDCPMELQAKLLHVVDTGRFRPLGGGEERETTKRILLATNRNLPALVADGKFRQDLLWRIDAQLSLPALREQPENIEDIARAIQDRQKHSYENALVTLPSLAASDLKWARGYRWPGNVRQLERAIAQFLIRGGRLPLKDIALEQERQFAGSQEGSLAADLRRMRAIGSPGAALQRGEMLARREVLAWFDEVAPDNAILRRIFPDVKPHSVRVKISQWRAELNPA